MKLFDKLTSKFQNPVTSLQFIHLLRFTTLFLISIAFAKSNYSIIDIGLYEKFIYFAGALSFFWTNGIIQAFLSLYHQHSSKFSQNKILINSLVLSFLFSCIITIIVLCFEKPFSKFFINSSELPFKTLFILYLTLSPLTYFIEYIYLILKKYRAIYTYGIISYMAQLVLLSVPAFLYQNLSYSILGLIIITSIRFVWLLFLLLKYFHFIISKSDIVQILKYSLPLILSAFIAGSLPYIDGLLVAKYFDDKTFAIFRYGARELPISVLLANAFSNAMIPIISESKSIAASLRQIKTKSLQMMHVLFPLSILLLVSSYFLFEIAFNPYFRESATIFNVMLLLVIPRMLFPQTILIAKNYQHLTLIASVVEWIVKLLLSIWMMYLWGIFGIAVATFIAFLIEKFVLSLFVFNKLNIGLNRYVSIKWFLFYSLILLATFVIIEHSSFK
ncbi:MAG: polysaccharide biosynthesis C-terminal domain-containing protein [Bacteroidales bacterium]|nr:polysaccharide biosynthesis C-terminal domain-containing protein [Bacteroidales bacterium]